MLAVDMSNYSSPLTSENLQALKDAGVRLVIVQAVDPPAGYPAGVTRQQIKACLAAGLKIDAYVWLWFDLDVSDIVHKLGLIVGLPIRQVWLDVEDTAAIKYDQATCEQKVAAALEQCDAVGVSEPTGIYSGRWFWTDRRYMGNTTAFADRELWDSNFDDVADAALGFVPYGGWTAPRIKQYRGTTSLAGISGLDLNVLSVAEAAELEDQDVKIPAEYVTKFHLANDQDIGGLIGNFEGVITTVRDIAFAEGQAEGASAEAKLERIKEVVNT